jgi:hypothetical protein
VLIIQFYAPKAAPAKKAAAKGKVKRIHGKAGRVGHLEIPRRFIFGDLFWENLFLNRSIARGRICVKHNF